MASHTSTIEKQQRDELRKTTSTLLALVRIVSDFEGSAVAPQPQDAALCPFGVLNDMQYVEEHFALMEMNERKDRQADVDKGLAAARKALKMWTSLKATIMQFADATGFATDKEIDELVAAAFESAVFGVSDPQPGVPELQTDLYADVNKYAAEIAKAKDALPPVARSMRLYFANARVRDKSMMNFFSFDKNNYNDDNLSALVDRLDLSTLAQLRGLCKDFRYLKCIDDRWPRLRLRSSCGQEFGFPAFQQNGVLKVSERQASELCVDIVLPCPGNPSDVDNFNKHWDELQKDPDYMKKHGPRPKSCLQNGLTLHQMAFSRGMVQITVETVYASGRPAPRWLKPDANSRHRGWFHPPAIKPEQAKTMHFYEPPCARSKVWWRRTELANNATRPPPLRLKIEAVFKTKRFGGEFTGKLTTLSPIFVVVARHPKLCRSVLEKRRHEAIDLVSDEE